MTSHQICGCCSGVRHRTPGLVWNRPGLSDIRYRVARHGDFLASMIAGLTGVDRPELADLTTRDDDDFTIALLDAWAVAGDVITFYTERLANESYLRTSVDRSSLQELGKLIGYQLGPGAAAETRLAFAVEPPPAKPDAESQDPGSAPPPTPASVKLEKGLRVQSVPGPGEKPQTFETIEEITARPEWNAVAASTSKILLPEKGDTSTWLDGSSLNLQKGDVLLLAGPQVIQDRWDVRVLTKVKPDTENDRTRVHWDPGLGSSTPDKDPASQPEPYVLRKRINVFGHNAPSWSAMSSTFRSEYPGTGSGDKWPNWYISDKGRANRVDLDGSHPDVVAGSWVVLSRPGYRELFEVGEVDELARADYAMSGKITRLTLTGGENWVYFDDRVRDTTVYAVSEPLELADVPDTSPVSGDEIELARDISNLPAGRGLLVVGTTTTGVRKTERVVLDGTKKAAGRRVVELKSSLTHSYKRDTVVIYGNVAKATHGETVSEVLGSGDAASPFQRFELAHSPLTYVQSTDPTGIETTLEVRINDVRWDEETTLYEEESEDRSYTVRTDAEGKRRVQFGDGVSGARLPTGSQNVRAKYRKGIGINGNVGAESLSQLIDRPLGIKGVSNPAGAGGGVDQETSDKARGSMPLNVRTLGRAVSLLDYEDFARAFTGVAKASATVLPLRGGQTIVVTVALQPGTTTGSAARLKTLAGSLRKYGDPRVQVAVVDYTSVVFRLALRVGVIDGFEAKKVLSDVASELQDTYQFTERRLGEPIWQSEIVAAAHGTKGVTSVDVDRLYTGTVSGIADRLVPPQPAVASDGSAIASGLLVLDTDPFDWLEEMT